MEANEIQIGDWVTCKKWRENPFKLTRINDNGKYYYGTIASGTQVGPFLIEEIEPIHLTSEILEKNGFEVQDQGGGRKDVWTGFSIDCEGDIEVEFQNNIPVHLKIDGGFKGEYYTSTNIKYIHQLQHILRLCGIEKTIEI